jgi:endonuclease/exonuclease/phosphatase family metal-dependent hydrolase
MPTIYDTDEDESVDPHNAAAREYQHLERLARGDTKDAEEDSDGSGLPDDDSSQSGDSSAGGSHSSGKGSSKSGGLGGSGTKSGGAVTNNAGSQSKFQQRMGAFWEGAANKYGGALKNKWLVGAGVGGSGLGIIILILLMMLSAYKIPHVTENISAWRFARVMSRSVVQNERTMSTKIAIDAADESGLARLRASYYTGKGRVADTWSKLDKYRPNKQIANLNASGMRFNYDGKKLVGITINDKTLLTPKTSFIKNRIPFYKFTQDIKTASLFQPELDKALRAKETGPIVRGIVNSKLRKQLGINYIAWKAGQYKGKTAEQVRIAEEQANAKAVATKDTTKPVTQQLANDVDDAEKAQEDTINDPDKVKQAIANDGVSSEVAEAVDKVGKGSAFKTVLGFLSAPYAIAVPVCIVYDGSIDNSASTVDADSARQIKSWNRLGTEGDQQKDSSTVDPKIIQAVDTKLGDPSNTVVMKRVSGKQYTTTDGAPSPQASANGTYTLFDRFFDGAPDNAVGAANYLAGHTCSTLTNEKVAVGFGIASLVAGFFSGGSSEVAMSAAGQAARVGITRGAEKAVARFSIKQGLRSVGYSITGGAKLKVFLGKELAKGGAVAGTTLLAKYYVSHRAGLLNNGLEQAGDYVTQVDSGADLEANEISRRGQFGRPLSESEVKAANAETAGLVAQSNESKNTYQRYLALSNPNSLLTNISTTISSGMGGNAFTSFFRSLGSVFSPRNFAHITSNILNPTAQAAQASGQANYRNIQWGWTKAEVDKIRHNTSYEILENQTILDNSGKEDEIATTYGKCFGTDDTTIGTLLAKGDIKRDDQANVLNDDSLCSPKNLSFSNPTYGDLVFRWRVAQADRNDLDEKVYEQEVVETTAVVTGDTQLNIATFNIHHSDDSSVSWHSRLRRSVDVLASAQVDVAGLQEVRPDQNAAFRQEDYGGSIYDIYPAADSNGGNFSPNPIIWNKSKYKRVGQVTDLKVSYFEDSAGQTSQEVPIIKLQSIETGQQFYVANTHDPADTATHGDNANLRLANANRYVPYFKQLSQESGLPIFFTGDFNNRYDLINSPGNNPAGNVCQNLTYRIISKGGVLQDAYDNYKNRAAPDCPKSAATPENANSIDHIFVSKSVQIDSFKNMKNQGSGNNGSDHNTVVAHAIISGSSLNSSSFMVGTYNLKHEIVWGGNCKLNECAEKRSQKQANIILGKSGMPQMDIVGSQEVSIPQHNRFKTMLTNYGYFPNEVPENQGNAIYWSQAKFKKVGDGFIDTINNVAKPFRRPWVELQTLDGSQTVFVMSTHAPNDLYGTAANRKTVAQDALIWAKSKSSATNTVIVMGDFNEPSEANNTYCIFTAGGFMKNALDRGNCPNLTCNNSGGTCASGIDQIYYTTSGAATASNWGRPSNEEPFKSASDHLPVYATITLPGTEKKSGDTTATPGSDFVGNDGFGGGSCVLYVEYILKRHSSKYHGQVDITTGTDGMAAYTVATNLGRTLGYTVNHTPAVHAVVSFPTNLANPSYGHVAIVAKVNSDGSIVVEESNWSNGNAYGTHTVSAATAARLTYAHTEEGWH